MAQADSLPTRVTRARLAILQDGLQLVNEIVHILEFPVHAGKPHIGHLVEIPEVFHHEFAQRTRLDLGIKIGIHVAFDVRHQPVNLLVTDRSFPAGSGQPVADLFAAKRFATTILFHDLDGHLFRALIGAVASATVQTVAPAANGETIIHHP